MHSGGPGPTVCGQPVDCQATASPPCCARACTVHAGCLQRQGAIHRPAASCVDQADVDRSATTARDLARQHEWPTVRGLLCCFFFSPCVLCPATDHVSSPASPSYVATHHAHAMALLGALEPSACTAGGVRTLPTTPLASGLFHALGAWRLAQVVHLVFDRVLLTVCC